jgi:hypothetical protein
LWVFAFEEEEEEVTRTIVNITTGAEHTSSGLWCFVTTTMSTP